MTFGGLLMLGGRAGDILGRRSTITQTYEGTNQIQRMVMACQLLR